jgi:hypothetical protein
MAHGAILYFSFVTLTSTGFGDIAPVHPVARMLANLEGIIGQFYPATMIARLITLELRRHGQPAQSKRQAGSTTPVGSPQTGPVSSDEAHAAVSSRTPPFPRSCSIFSAGFTMRARAAARFDQFAMRGTVGISEFGGRVLIGEPAQA